MKGFSFSFYLLLFSFGLTWCTTKEEFPIKKDYPVVYTNSVKDLGVTGATLSAKLIDKGRAEIVDYGFLLIENEIEYKLSLLNVSELEIFEITLHSDLKKGVPYSYRAYIQTTKNLIYGNEMEFVSEGSLAPEIVDFSPKVGYDSTTVTIYGNSFSSFPARNKVTINNIACKIVASSSDSIVFQTPKVSFFGEFKISVEVANQISTSTDYFTILGPEIFSLSLYEAFSGDELTLKGRNFTQNGENLKVTFNGVEAVITKFSDQSVELLIPVIGSLFADQNVEVVLKNGLKSASINIGLKRNWGKKASSGIHNSSRVGSFSFNNFGYVYNEGKLYQYRPQEDEWFFLGQTPRMGGSNGFFVSYGDKVFKFSAATSSRDFWEYYPLQNTWIQKDPLPFDLFYRATYFVLNQFLYIINSDQALWRFDFNNETFLRLNDSPVRYSGFGFVSNNLGYLVTYGETYQYNEQNDSWTEKATNDFYTNPSSSFGPFIVLMSRDIGMVVFQRGVYKYDSFNDRWLHVSTLPDCMDFISSFFEINDKIYLSIFNDYCPNLYEYSQ